MNANKARELTEFFLHPDIDTLVAAIDRRIEEAAKNGQNHITDPDIGHPGLQITPEQRNALRRHYESRGFKWQVSPKAGHSCCLGLTSISW